MSTAAESDWPSHFPADCPPDDANALDGNVYMLVETDPPTPKDTECAMDRGSHPNKPSCVRAALSCARSRDHLEELQREVPRLRRHVVAVAALGPEHGKIKQTGREDHYSMWMRAKYLHIGHTLFKVHP